MTSAIAQNSSMIMFFAQLFYWFFTVLFLGYAVFQYKRWVNFQLGIGRSGKLRNAETAAQESEVSVEEFVE